MISPLIVSFGKRHPAKIVKRQSLSWEDFAGMLTQAPPAVSDKADRGWYCPVDFNPSYRDSDNFVARYALTFDFDEVSAEQVARIRTIYPYAAALYTTFSHTPEKPRFRLVSPLSRPASYDEFQAVSRKIAEKLGIELMARESHVPSQMMYLPTVKVGAEHWSEIKPGKPVPVDKILGLYTDWTDKSQWPHRRERDGTHNQAAAGGESPTEKPGLIGAFCRAYRIPDAIAKFGLPYEPTQQADRWTYTAGSRPEGAVLYDDGLKLHSHHDSDPARGQHNAFDLVRLHRFGALDTDPGLPITEQPSYKAMCHLAASLPELQQAQADVEFEALPDDPEADAPATEAPKRFRVVPAPEFATAERLRWLVKGVVPRAELIVMYGESGSGKSFLALDVCAAVSQGLPWRSKAVEKGRVVYVCAEGAGGFRARLRAYSQARDVDLAHLPAVVPDAPNLLETKDVKALTASIKAHGADLIVIDTLSATTPGGNENSGDDMGKALAHCKALHRATGAVVVLIHHSGKDKTKGSRGWSGLKAAADAEIEVTRSGDYRAATVTKMKDGSDGARWGFKLKNVVLGVDDDGDEITSCVIEHTEDAPPREKPRGPTGVIAKLVYETAVELLAELPEISNAALLEASVNKLPKPEGKRDQRLQRCERALDSLVSAEHLILHGNGRKVSLSTAEEVEDD